MKALLVVSFGSTHSKGLQTLNLMKQAIEVAFPNRRIYTAFTSQTILHLLNQKNIMVNSMNKVMQQLLNEGVDDLIIEPLFILKGKSYQKMYHEVLNYQSYFKSFSIGNVLLDTFSDYQEVTSAFKEYLNIPKENKAIIGMGHGSDLNVSQSYHCLNTLFQKDSAVYIATLMSQPTLDDAINWLLQGHYQEVSLIPFMIVAGYHMTKDMKQLWIPKLQQAGFKVEIVQNSLGDIPRIRALFVSHAKMCESYLEGKI